MSESLDAMMQDFDEHWRESKTRFKQLNEETLEHDYLAASIRGEQFEPIDKRTITGNGQSSDLFFLDWYKQYYGDRCCMISLRQIAEVYGVSPSTVQRNVRQARKLQNMRRIDMLLEASEMKFKADTTPPRLEDYLP